MGAFGGGAKPHEDTLTLCGILNGMRGQHVEHLRVVGSGYTGERAFSISITMGGPEDVGANIHHEAEQAHNRAAAARFSEAQERAAERMAAMHAAAEAQARADFEARVEAEVAARMAAQSEAGVPTSAEGTD